uniref:Uncharacterized protein n=1 Tax=Anopheles christyi TaxID=43041 RepID=A0A182K2Z0_9DIPT
MKYGQPECIVHDLTKQISSLSTVSEGQFDDLGDFALTVQIYCATVEACEVNGYLYNDMLLHILCQKLPPSLSLRWAEFEMEEDCRALTLLENQTTFVGQQYECGLLWKYDHVHLAENKAMAIRRWKCLELRMQKDAVLANVMKEKMKEYRQTNCRPSITAYVNVNKPGKIRIVWDAAAKVHGISLNSALLKGPDQVSSLVSILKFREFKVGICGDVSPNSNSRR